MEEDDALKVFMAAHSKRCPGKCQLVPRTLHGRLLGDKVCVNCGHHAWGLQDMTGHPWAPVKKEVPKRWNL